MRIGWFAVVLLILALIFGCSKQSPKPEPIPDTPTLSSPASNSTTTDNTPSFDWSDPAHAYRYELIVDNNSSFNSPEINQTDLSSSNYTPSSSLNEDTYYWKVRARNSEGTWGAWSSTWTFTVDIPDPVPGPPTLIAPDNNSTITDDTPEFEWSEPTYAHRYELTVDNNSSFNSPEIDQQDLGASNYTPLSGLSDGTYYWKVRARNSEDAWGEWSSTWSFILNTSSSPTPGTVSPGGWYDH
jgi:hypothetical protein